MELLFTNNRRKSVYVDVYIYSNDALFGRYFKQNGEQVEFIVPDTENMRELLRTGYITAILHRRGNFAGSVSAITHKFYIDGRHIAKIVYEEFYGKTDANIFMVEQGMPTDYRKENLSLTIKDMTYSADVLENRKQFIDRTLIAHKDVDRDKRLTSSYSNKLSDLQTRVNRERSKLDLELVAEIRELSSKGVKQGELVELFEMSRTALADILLYRTWNIHEFKEEDIAPVDLQTTPEIPYRSYADEPTKLHVGTVRLFVCNGFVYKLQQKVDFQVYLSKHLPTGELVSDAHLTYTDNPRGINKYRNYIISSVRGNKLANYYMTKQDVYSIIHSYMQYGI